MSRNVVLLFPGQGAYLPGVLEPLSQELPELRRAFSEVDAVAAGAALAPVSEAVTGSSSPELERLLLDAPPHILQLTLYASAVGLHRTLAARGLRPTALVGHSLGEIAALVCGGAFTVAEGAEIVLRRTAVVGEANPGGAMLALGQPRARVQQLLDVVGDPDAVVAAENGPSQTVVSGPDSALEAVEAISRALRISAVRLRSPFPFHSPLLAGASRQLADQLAHLRQRPLTTPVFSPILGRFYTDDDLLTASLAAHLTQPVRFTAALTTLAAAGADLFVEAGIGSTLTKLVAASHSEVDAVPCVEGAGDVVGSFAGVAERLAGWGVITAVSQQDPTQLLLPDVPTERRRAFWSAHGPEVERYVRGLLDAFDAVAAPAGPTAQPPAEPDQQPARTPVLPATSDTPAAAPARHELLAELCEMYALALEYPVEVFTEDLELEADLGVDSVKQTELLSRAADRYHLPERPAEFRLSDCSTMGKVTDFVLDGLLSSAGGPADGVPRG